MKFLTCSSLEKIFPEGESPREEKRGNMLRNERYHFQAAIYWEKTFCDNAELKILGTLSEATILREVVPVPARFTAFPDHDDGVLFEKDTARLYPDVLCPFDSNNRLTLRQGQWTAVWVTIKGVDLPVGVHKIVLSLLVDNKECGTAEYELEVVDAFLPRNDLIVTNWIHYDGIARDCSAKPFDDVFYTRFSDYLTHAVDHGVNMLYVPMFTPPLDTAVGAERMTVQLVDVVETEGGYSFGFSRLGKFLDFAREMGIEYFEMSHLTTQWGACFCPKIEARGKNGDIVRIFGWNTPSLGREYQAFLSQFLPALDVFLKEKGVADRCYFHVSDEPRPEHRAQYEEVHRRIRALLPDYRFMDAVEEVGKELLDAPVVCTTHIPDKPEEGFWAYYCCTSYRDGLSNRFLNMPSVRNRILGAQLYLSGVKGFLHWGFNFYNSVLSRRNVNPFEVTDADGGFPAGDSFVVYPGKDGVLDSLRLEVFFDGLQDRLALKLLERSMNTQEIENLLEKVGVKGWRGYPQAEAWLELRRIVNRLLGGQNKFEEGQNV